MRTSDELTYQHKCSEYRNDIPLSNYHPQKIYRQVHEEVLSRLLHGEHIADIPAELGYQLNRAGYHFEDSIQQNNRLFYGAKDILRFVNSDRRTPQFVSEEEAVINFRGEEIKVLPTYYYVDNGEVCVVKIKADTPKQVETESTGKQHVIDERENDESYALMLLARKLRDEIDPNLGCRVEIDHLFDEYEKPKRGMARTSYIEDFFDPEHEKNITEIHDGAYYDEFFRQKWEIEDAYPQTCGGASCGGCACYNACHYTEPPLSADTSNVMKDPDDVQLSYAQRQVTEHASGSMLVDSGAGAGKTTCITMNLLNHLRAGVSPSKCLLLTFTNAAAKEMMDRLAIYTRAIQADPERADQLPADLDLNDITGVTFNGLCQKIIEAHYEELGFSRVPAVIPDEVEQQMVHEIFNIYPEKIPIWNYNKPSKSIYDKSSNYSFGKSAAEEFLNLVLEVKMTPDDEYRFKAIEDYGRAKGLDHRYVTQLKMMVEDFESAHFERINGLNSSGKCYITYLDQFLLVEKLYQMHPTLWDEYGFSHIIVDEVQDSNTTQLKLLQRIQNNASYESLLAVGDMQQSIYGFNGAVPENMLHDNYETFFGPTEYVGIRENFRCSRNIIGFTNDVIDNIIEKTTEKGIPVGDNEYEHLVGTRGETQGVKVNGYYSQSEQMEDIARQIKDDIEHGTMPGDIMFITRNKPQLHALASELTKLDVPSVLRCPVPYMDNSNVGSAISFMDSFLYGYDSGYFDYCNQLEHGELFTAEADEVMDKVNALKADIESKDRGIDTLREYLNNLDPEKRDECYQSFLKNFSYAKDLNELENQLTAFKQHGSKSTFKREATYSEVQLSTIHSAKGLESKVVYCDIAKLDTPAFHERRLPSAVAKEYKETNRLEYVAYTRAKDKLVVTAPYVLADRGGRPVLNQRLINAYHAVGRTYGYNFMEYMAHKDAARAQTTQLQEEDIAEYIAPRIDDVQRQYENIVADQVSFEESVQALGLDWEDFSGSARA